MKKIMILSSTYTGHGHASIAQALTEQLDAYEDVRCKVVDGFALIGKAGIGMSKLYGPITRNARDLWKMGFSLADQHPATLRETMAAMIHDKFLKTLASFTPDLILTVHSFFNGSVLDILETYNLNIPFYALQADIINIHSTWCDPRAALTLCPTREAYDCSIRHGMPPEKLKICGFPTRARFCDAARTADTPVYQGDRPINCLMMSGGEGSGNLLAYAGALLQQVNCRLEIVCGRNKKLQEILKRELTCDSDRLAIHGFVENVHEIMLRSDLLIARGSPNTLMEAVVLGLPLIITGSLPGQEADNPAMMVAHNLGVICGSAESLPAVVNTLMDRDGKRLKEIRAAQREYRNLDNARNIAAFLHETAVSTERELPRKRMIFLPPRLIARRSKR